MKAGEIRKERTHRVLPLRLREEGVGEEKEKRTRLSHRADRKKNGFFARETLNFLLNFLKEVKRVFTGKNSRRNCECAKWNMDRDSISFPFEAKLHRSEIYNTYGFRKTRFRFLNRRV